MNVVLVRAKRIGQKENISRNITWIFPNNNRTCDHGKNIICMCEYLFVCMQETRE